MIILYYAFGLSKLCNQEIKLFALKIGNLPIEVGLLFACENDSFVGASRINNILNCSYG